MPWAMLLIDTALVPQNERVNYWSEASWDAYHPLEIRSREERFSARMWGCELGPLAFFRIAAAANTMRRTAEEVAAGDPDCVHFSVMLHGRLSVTQDGRTAVVGRGDILSYETSKPVVARADSPFEALVVKLPRELLGGQAARISRLTAVRIPGSDGLPRVAVPFLRGLAYGLEDGTIVPSDPVHLAECVLDLALGVYAGRSLGRSAGGSRSGTEILANVKAFIEANLGDPNLDPEQIARASFISTRYLHKLFEAEGVSVCQWIRKARLERCRRDLLDPSLGDHTILAIASRWGLPGAQHFSRLFRTAYGCTPSDFRRLASAAS
jgi:AraC-like DNA-binding protein